jgi:AraC-like DNA-binding protein
MTEPIGENWEENVTSRVFLRAGVLTLRLAARPQVLVNLPLLARSCLYRVDAISDAVGTSSRYLNSLFVCGIGIGLKAWLRELRFVDMVQYLREGQRIDEVALKVGLSHSRQVHREINRFSEMPWRDFMAQFVWSTDRA